jgi:hypothetical protein
LATILHGNRQATMPHIRGDVDAVFLAVETTF